MMDFPPAFLAHQSSRERDGVSLIGFSVALSYLGRQMGPESDFRSSGVCPNPWH